VRPDWCVKLRRYFYCTAILSLKEEIAPATTSKYLRRALVVLLVIAASSVAKALFTATFSVAGATYSEALFQLFQC
jgi:hypothetical protein